MQDIYRIRRFLLFPTNNKELVVQNDTGIVKIKDERLKKLLFEITEKQDTSIERGNLEKFLDEDTHDGIEFLKKYGIIESFSPLNFEVNKLRLVTNNSEVGNIVNNALKSVVNDYEFINTSNYETVYKHNDINNSFWFFFLSPYSKQKAKTIRDEFLKSKNSYLVISYIYNNSLYIDSVYSPQLKLPCHLCQLGNIESELRSQTSASTMNYQEMVDELYKQEDGFQVGGSINSIQALNIATQLSNRITKYVGVNRNHRVSFDDFGQGLVMNLYNFGIHMDTTLHWELCDCYE